MNKFIFFRNDRLGDFIILTNIIKSIKKKYKDSHITVCCSNLNQSLVRKYQFIDKIYVFNKNFSIFKKISLFKRIIKEKYYVSFSVDGKTFSNLCNFFISSKYKLGLVYKYKFFNLWFGKPNFFYKYLIFDKFETFTSKKNLTQIEHLPTKLINLSNFLSLNLKTKDKYFFEKNNKDDVKFKKYYSKLIKKNYILIHLDEKWNNINSVDKDLFSNLISLQKLIKKKIIITSFKNNLKYFINLKKMINLKINNDLMIIENSSLSFFERLINYSFCSISCHSGFLVQVAGANSTKIVDIIDKKDLIWYSSWKPKNTHHKFVFKSNRNKKFFLKKIFKDLAKQIRNF